MQVFDIIKKAAVMTDSVIVGFSGGKDSIVTLDLCLKHFKHVEAYFLYIVSDLEFQEVYLRYIEKRYTIKIHRLPHWMLGRLFKDATYRPHNKKTVNCPVITINDIENELYKLSGIEWFASGQKACDSIERNAMLRRNNGIDEIRKRIYPVTFFTNKTIFSYLKMNNIPLPPDYRILGHSFGSLWGKDLKRIKETYPNDYKKILEVFPYVEAAIKRDEFKQVPAF